MCVVGGSGSMSPGHREEAGGLVVPRLPNLGPLAHLHSVLGL